MTDKEWSKFFELLEKIVDLPDKSVDEKIQEVMAHTGGEKDEMNLEEFTAWIFEF